ncbi:MAG: hypothetical protein ACI4QL_00430 [Candidatus Fimimonas sp.]
MFAICTACGLIVSCTPLGNL